MNKDCPGQGDFTGEIKGEGGIRRVYSMARVNSADGLVVVTKIRADEIYRPSRRRLMLHLSGLAIVGLLVLGVTGRAAIACSPGRFRGW